MISKQHRFHGHASLRYVYQNGSVVRGPWFSVRHARNPRRNTYRAAVVVSKKISKSAVTRNRIRRRLYEVLRAHEESIEAPHDVVITVYGGSVLEAPFEQLSRELGGQLQKAGVTARRPATSR